MKATYSKIYNLLTSSERRGALILLVLMMVGMLLETLGIGLIIPAITLMMQADLAITPILDYFGRPSKTVLITAVMLGLVGVYLVKNLFLAFLIWKQTHFVYDVKYIYNASEVDGRL